MSAEKTNSVKKKRDLKGGFGLQPCSNPECSQVFDEKSEAYWKFAPRKMICTKCESEVVLNRTGHAANSSEMLYIYWCDFCKEEFGLKIPLTRKYCSVCKVDWHISWAYDLRAPLPPYDPSNSCIPLNPGSTAA